MENKCSYCCQIATTVDHIPSKCLFPTIKGYNLITVPSCETCNKSYSIDEVFFRDHIAAFTSGRSLTSDYLFDTKIRRSIVRRPGLAVTMFNKMSKVNYYSKSGVYMGKRTAVKMSQADWDRIYRILTKNTKGLFYHHFGVSIPTNFVIKHFQMSGDEIKEKYSDLLNTIIWVIPKYDSIFRYGYSNVPSMADSIWLTDYFKNAGFLTFVRDPKNINDGNL